MIKRGKNQESEKLKPAKAEQLIIENFVALQNVMTDLTISFNKLSKNISELLELFEGAAKSVVEKEVIKENAGPDTKELMKKIEYLIEQNKTLAKGIILLHEKTASAEIEEITIPAPKMLPSQGSSPSNMPARGMQGYQKSIAAGS